MHCAMRRGHHNVIVRMGGMHTPSSPEPPAQRRSAPGTSRGSRRKGELEKIVILIITLPPM